MNLDTNEVNRRIAKIEAAWFDEDRRTAHGAADWTRPETVTFALVTLALATAAALLAAGLATASPLAWLLGNAAFVSAFAVPLLFRRRAFPQAECERALPPVRFRVWYPWRTSHLRRAGRAELSNVAGDMSAAEVSLQPGREDEATRAATTASTRGWQRSVVVIGQWSEVADELRAADGLGNWCRGLRWDQRDESMAILGRLHPVRIRIVRRTWFAEGIRLHADAGGALIKLRLTMRPLPSRENGVVEVAVNAEGPDTRRSRRVLRVMKRQAASALHRWSTDRRHRPPFASSANDGLN